ncbi:MAG: recombination protein RecR, partial [Synergistaceae bacterium]|nr:recombination protein RecR [Synergistaceae bacterium]
LYHVLNERVAPFDGEDLSPEGVKFLVSHIKRVKPKEVIIATNPKMEGDLTYYSLLDILKKARGLRKDMKITRLAFGLPVGGAIGYADRLTLHTALESRVEAEFNNGGF